MVIGFTVEYRTADTSEKMPYFLDGCRFFAKLPPGACDTLDSGFTGRYAG